MSDEVSGWTVFLCVVGGVVVVVLFVFLVVIPMEAGHWAMDRLGHPWDNDAVILRQDEEAEPLFLCADGDFKKQTNCVDVATFLEFARAHGVPYDKKRLAKR